MQTLKSYYIYLAFVPKLVWLILLPIALMTNFLIFGVIIFPFEDTPAVSLVVYVMIFICILYYLETFFDFFAFPEFMTKGGKYEYIKTSIKGRSYIKKVLTCDIIRRFIYMLIAALTGIVVFNRSLSSLNDLFTDELLPKSYGYLMIISLAAIALMLEYLMLMIIRRVNTFWFSILIVYISTIPLLGLQILCLFAPLVMLFVSAAALIIILIVFSKLSMSAIDKGYTDHEKK